MSKSKNSKYYGYYNDYGYEDYYVADSKKKDKRKEKRLHHALKTKNIDEFLQYEDDCVDANDNEEEIWIDRVSNANI